MSVVGAVFIQSKRGKASEHDVTDDISESGPRTGPWKSGPKSLDPIPNQGNSDHASTVRASLIMVGRFTMNLYRRIVRRLDKIIGS